MCFQEYLPESKSKKKKETPQKSKAVKGKTKSPAKKSKKIISSDESSEDEDDEKDHENSSKKVGFLLLCDEFLHFPFAPCPRMPSQCYKMALYMTIGPSLASLLVVRLADHVIPLFGVDSFMCTYLNKRTFLKGMTYSL